MKIKEIKEIMQYIPLDKSWMIRLGVLDILNGYDDITKFLSKQTNLSDDLQALYRVAQDWNSNQSLDVGESATLYRFLKFASWKYKLNKEFIKRGTLRKRKICNNPKIVNWPLEKLQTLDYGTSQWASASVLLGNKEIIQNPPYKLKLTYEAVSHWKERRSLGLCWIPREDETILRQALAYIELLETDKTSFIPEHSEDYCFARAFNLITSKEARKKWPSLYGHESKRIKHMEDVINQADKNEIINSTDHRAIQANVLSQKFKNKPVYIRNRNAVNKSWPRFYDFVQYCEKFKRT
jgi:hypothetical protein